MPFKHPSGPRTLTLIQRSHQVQSSSTGIVTAFVLEHWQIPGGRTFSKRWQFTFAPKPGDVLAQVAERLQQ